MTGLLGLIEVQKEKQEQFKVSQQRSHLNHLNTNKLSNQA